MFKKLSIFVTQLFHHNRLQHAVENNHDPFMLQQDTLCSEHVREGSIIIPSDMIFHMYQFLDWKFIISVCSKVSKRWYLKSLEIPIALDLSECKEPFTLKYFSNSVLDLLRHLTLKCRNRWTELNLKACRVAYEGAACIASSPFMRNLTFLNLQNNDLGNEGIRLIVNSENSKHLTGLVLTQNHFGYSGISAIATSENLKQLQTLHLGHNNIESEGLMAICDSSVLKHLTSLDLSYNSIGSEIDIQRLSNSSIFSHLTELNLSGNRIYSQHVKFIASSPILKNLRTLDIGDNFLVSDGAQFIAQGTCFQNLQTLKLSMNNIQNEGVQYLSEKMQHLTWLDLSENNLDDRGIISLANQETSRMKNLTALFLEKNYILAHGIAIIAHNVHLSQQIQILNVSENFIRLEGIQVLCEHMKHLTSLHVSGCMIGDAGIECISLSENLTTLTCLNISFNDIGTEGAMSLASSHVLTRLKQLEISHNHVGFYGANAIATSPLLKVNLERLEISGNCIGVEGEKIIREQCVNLKGFHVQERRSFEEDDMYEDDDLDELLESDTSSDH